MQFQFKRRENEGARQGQGQGSGGGDGIDDLRVDSSARFDAGLGGRAQSGQWQIELASVPTDPRDQARSTGTAQAAVDLRSDISLAALSVQEEEFPSLPGDTRNSGPALWAHSATTGGKRASQSRKEAEFPSLPASKASVSSLKKAALAPKSNSGKVSSASSSSMLSSIVSSASLSTVGEASVSYPSQVAASLYSTVPTTEDFPSMASAPKKPSAAKTAYSADSSFRGAVQENASASLAVRLHMSREPISMRAAAEEAHSTGAEAYPSLATKNGSASNGNSTSKMSTATKAVSTGPSTTKKPATAPSASISSWGSALGSAGIAIPSKKKEKKAGIAVARLPFAKTAASASGKQADNNDTFDETKLIGRVKSASSLDEKYVAPASIKNK